ncbi:hypothetical protein QE422_002578 [Chryseobacterium sp. SORGH_AS 447]|uniref:hypothetical protein n=1 Tax=Chryseobacterium sp. SORGH_AS_0447 TaxID=3041769 RepID=UPI002780209D|nr:hypothetical protein [Chryseobacterium sp. SORGH_AS_0447]MDQ1162210.1 hypothetical protein [Chryseobacterium sp. SORGH_AS_0447]
MVKQLLTVMCLVPFISNAQVGINTTNPQTTFHVDGAKDNPTTGAPSASQQLNDVTIDANGNIGVGTIAPSAKLQINAGSGNALKITDTSEGLGKVLTSDSSGNARWAAPGTSFAKLATIPTTEQTVATIDDPLISGDQRIAYSGAYVTLSPGKYQVNFTMWCAPTGSNAASSNANDGFASVFLSTSSSANTAPDYLTPIKSIIIPRLYNAASANPDYYGSGNIAVNITQPTTLYLWVYMSGGNWSSTATRSIRFRFDPGSYGPYVQMYAVPFEVE